MLTVEQHDRITRVGAGTPMGELMRRWWHPVAVVPELDQKPTKAVRLLGEDFVLFRTSRGEYGLVAQRCPHRAMDMLYGIPEEDGLRCAYHGWLFDLSGQCIEQPAEPPGSRFKEKVRIGAHPAQELGGLVWAYIGPEPVPLLPRWDILTWEGVYREATACVLPCNWLQCVDNALDPTHVEHLHGIYGEFAALQRGGEEAAKQWRDGGSAAHHLKIGFDRFPYGIIKRRVTTKTGGQGAENWTMGHPIVLPSMLRQGYGNHHTFLLRVPIDDEHTWHIQYLVSVPEADGTFAEEKSWWWQRDEMPLEGIKYSEIQIYGDDGRILDSSIPQQDILAWIGQGPISDRTNEHLGLGDVGLIMFHRMLDEQVQVVEEGGEPMNVFRDPEQNQCIALPQERTKYLTEEGRLAAHAWDNFGEAEAQTTYAEVSKTTG